MKYEYRCTQCKWVFTIERKVEDKSKQACPQCLSMDTKRIISNVTVVYRGEGFTKKVEKK